jgi:hypothetical protein
LPISLLVARTRTMSRGGETAGVLALAAFVVLAIVGLAFGAGYMIGKLLL